MSLPEFTPEASPAPTTPRPLPEAVDLSEDVYARILEQVRVVNDQLAAERADLEEPADVGDQLPALAEPGIPAPLAPESLDQAGLSLQMACDLALKLVYLGGTLTGFEISRQMCLPFSAISEALDALKQDRCLEVISGEMMGRLSFRYHLTDAGRTRAREAFRLSRYVGPAPVSLQDYLQQCRVQSPRWLRFTLEELQAGLSDLVLDASFLRRLGPALCCGQALFLHGPSGSGKTAVALALGRLMQSLGSPIYVPYAITVEHQIITVFDPQVHFAPPSTPEEESAGEARLLPETDARWRRSLRPVVCAGGELNLEMLELGHQANSGFATAPLHVKANGGVFLLDDFGRQLIPPAQLLNRWILPLEDRHDFLTLPTGKKFSVPFEQLTVFSTNLPPEQLVDTAFLRRIRHKLKVEYPTEAQFREIFRRCCDQHQIRYDDWLVSRLLETRYNPQIPPKSSDPRDLLEGLISICRFQGLTPHLSEELLLEAFDACIGPATSGE